MKSVLMVAEKPSLATSIAKILSHGNFKSRKSACPACQVHEYAGRFNRSEAFFKMTSVCGHVFSLDFQSRYNNWDAVDPIELFDAETEKKEANPKLHMVKFLQQEARGVDYLVLWLDCDKEGENICYEVIDSVGSFMKHTSGSQNVFRAKFSAITDKDIRQAMETLGTPNFNEARSVDARQELDLRIGCAFTRFQTRYFQGKYGDLDSSIISYGPCQTPTLGFCVERHDQIQSFKPESYWLVAVKVSVGSFGSQTVSLEWDRVRLFDREAVQMFVSRVKESKTAKVLSVQQKEKTKARPIALNTVEMLRTASSGLGIGPQHTMMLAERLYVQGYISYPRTETTHYPENFDLKGALRQLSGQSSWAPTVKDLLSGNMQTPKKGHDAGDHPPITPLRAATETELGGDAWRLYRYIVDHFIATLSRDCRYVMTTATVDVNGELFSCSGKSVTEPGYTAVMTWQAIPSDERMPDVKKGDTLNVADVKLVERQTSPPDYLTESELITLMEKHGIGTDASIPVHINNICERNYVSIASGRRLIPTTLGIVLVHGYQKIDPDLVLPTMRSAVEEQLNLICHGKADFDSVLRHTLDIFTRKFRYFVEYVTSLDELFEVSFTKLSETGKPLSKCGICRHYMKLVTAKPTRLHCKTCDKTYRLPQNGAIKLYKELKCPLDEFELVLWTTGTRGKTAPVCPNCYNYPPFPAMSKDSTCSMCTHPTCKHSMTAHKVGACWECPSGDLVLDPTSGPKWKIACNKCNVLIHLCENAFRVSKSSTPCDECSSFYLVDVDFNKTNTPLSGGETRYQGCIFCDPVLNPLVQLHHAARQHPMYHRGRGRGRRRGRGRGHRGP
ncbi:DNA topoisomerase 3-beta-1-like [Oscarella lobularis]|uniref:DNA topoisomerase 3-beta-1-like n=1 Tax=Oscarella lobularis TaxID=121494 RepID=UPI0033134A4D